MPVIIQPETYNNISIRKWKNEPMNKNIIETVSPTVDGRNPAPYGESTIIYNLQASTHLKWCRISSINRITNTVLIGLMFQALPFGDIDHKPWWTIS